MTKQLKDYPAQQRTAVAIEQAMQERADLRSDPFSAARIRAHVEQGIIRRSPYASPPGSTERITLGDVHIGITA